MGEIYIDKFKSRTYFINIKKEVPELVDLVVYVSDEKADTIAFKFNAPNKNIGYSSTLCNDFDDLVYNIKLEILKISHRLKKYNTLGLYEFNDLVYKLGKGNLAYHYFDKTDNQFSIRKTINNLDNKCFSREDLINFISYQDLSNDYEECKKQILKPGRNGEITFL